MDTHTHTRKDTTTVARGRLPYGTSSLQRAKTEVKYSTDNAPLGGAPSTPLGSDRESPLTPSLPRGFTAIALFPGTAPAATAPSLGLPRPSPPHPTQRKHLTGGRGPPESLRASRQTTAGSTTYFLVASTAAAAATRRLRWQPVRVQSEAATLQSRMRNTHAPHQGERGEAYASLKGRDYIYQNTAGQLCRDLIGLFCGTTIPIMPLGSSAALRLASRLDRCFGRSWGYLRTPGSAATRRHCSCCLLAREQAAALVFRFVTMKRAQTLLPNNST